MESDVMIREGLLARVRTLERQIEYLKRDLLWSLTTEPKQQGTKPSLYGSVQGGDVTGGLIEQAKRQVLRDISDI